MQNPKLLILDELQAASVLTPQEADLLFVVLERLKGEGRTILYISHKLEEVKRLCDTAETICSGGKKVATCNPRQETAAASLARMMVGAEIGEVKAASGRGASVPRLVIHKLSLEPDDPHGTPRLQEISFEVRGGEIVGIAEHVAGNGQLTNCFPALSGERLASEGGAVVIDGEAGRLAQRHRPAPGMGAAFVPEERLGHGAPRRALVTNCPRTHCSPATPRGGMVKRGFIINKPAMLAHVDRTTKTFDVRKAKRDPEAVEPLRRQFAEIRGRPHPKSPAAQPGVLIVNQPTWGVDAGAPRRPFSPGADRSLPPAAPRFWPSSQDLDELAEIADRIAVMFHGRLSAFAGSGRSDAREARIANGRREPRAAGGGARGKACSWCLNGVPNARR